MANLYIAYDDVYLDWNLGSFGYTHPTNPIRALHATRLLAEALPNNVTVIKPKATEGDRDRLHLVHASSYISDVLDLGISNEWHPANTKLGSTALEMFAGTVRCAEKILSGEAQVAFNPQGAKHHAAYDSSSGFCVFNDMAWAALHFNAKGAKVMYIDWDAHHGDGVENLLKDHYDIVTCSIHDGTIFPGTGRDGHFPDQGIYNWALPAKSGSVQFADAIDEIRKLADEVKPDIVLLATGADAHTTDPLSTLNFTLNGYSYAASIVAQIANKYCEGRVLIGGAGGYQPFTHTPKIWSTVVERIYRNVEFDEEISVTRLDTRQGKTKQLRDLEVN